MARVPPPKLRRHVDADIVAAIAAAAKAVDGPLIQARYNEWQVLEANRWAPAATTVVKRFGSWNEALRVAGVEPLAPRNGRSRRMTMPALATTAGVRGSNLTRAEWHALHVAGLASRPEVAAVLKREGICPGVGVEVLCSERILRALYVEAGLSIDAAACVVGVGFRAVPPGRCSPVGSRAGLSWLKTRSLRGGPAAAQMSPATRAVW